MLPVSRAQMSEPTPIAPDQQQTFVAQEQAVLRTLDKVTARAKLEAAPTPEAALKWMNKNELTALVGTANELVPAYKPKAERQQKEG